MPVMGDSDSDSAGTDRLCTSALSKSRVVGPRCHEVECEKVDGVTWQRHPGVQELQ